MTDYGKSWWFWRLIVGWMLVFIALDTSSISRNVKRIADAAERAYPAPTKAP